MVKSTLPKFGYSDKQIKIICNCINVTKPKIIPDTLLEQIMVDADYDYLGRPDYHIIVEKLRQELSDYGYKMSEKEWLKYQLSFLEETHQYFTVSARNIRDYGKSVRINDLKRKLKLLN